jgi:hypothetical protein
MVENDPFGDSAGIERDVFFLETQRWMRRVFAERICSASSRRDDKTLSALRLEATYQLAEFLYLLEAQGIKAEDQLHRLTQLHNDYIVALTKDEEKMSRLGLARDRALDAIFTADTLPRLLQNWRERPGTFDQSNLARFLAIVMSAETCRKVVVACAGAGFLTRERTAYGTVLIFSSGEIERLFAACVREARHRFEGAMHADHEAQ